MLRIAKALANGRVGGGRKGRPNQEELRRALSTAYYALFQALAGTAADLFVGSSTSARKSPAWVHTHRSLQHGFAKSQCGKAASVQTFDPRIIAFAAAFATMQGLRYDADYNPAAFFYHSQVQIWIGEAEQALIAFNQAPRSDSGPGRTPTGCP